LAGDGANEENADDLAFFRKYKGMTTDSKERMRKMLNILDDD